MTDEETPVSQEQKLSIPLKLGWANDTTGGQDYRLYALDHGDAPRWAQPPRTAESPLIDLGAQEGSRWTLTEDWGDPEPRRFVLHRNVDHSGLSGTGTVAEGVAFTDGKIALRWVGSVHASTVLWDSIDDVVAIHGHGGDTIVVWLDA